MTKPKGQVLSI